MSLTSVKMSEDVWLTCLNHSLTTETEEIMGLLLGDIQLQSFSQLIGGCDCWGTTGLIEYLGNGGAVALIWGASPQTRSDRRKDRVETNPEQLAAASALAERMTQTTGRTTRVIGWYHSHPHITVLPSHVDVRTQAMYQLLDSGFIGLIFSCFSEDAYKVGRIQVTAFQSVDGKQRPAPRPVMTPFTNCSENVPSTSGSAYSEGIEQDTGDSRAAAGSVKTELEEFFAHADANSIGSEKREGDSAVLALMYHHDNSADTMDSMDMSASMQEAMHRSNLDMSGAEYIRKEIPLQVLPTRSLLKLDCPLTPYSEMQHVLFEEERAAYNQTVSLNMRDGKVHPLAFIHHTSTYQASMCKLIEYCYLCFWMKPKFWRLKQSAKAMKLFWDLLEFCKLIVDCEAVHHSVTENLLLHQIRQIEGVPGVLLAGAGRLPNILAFWDAIIIPGRLS
ncbi:uncharacterized protein [Aristolochia californica]|uniref:uncharacterized protein isoform X2 n=1 Tax=Aristolochia californica TaxID=171875 RepID=UPI0035D9E6E8